MPRPHFSTGFRSWNTLVQSLVVMPLALFAGSPVYAENHGTDFTSSRPDAADTSLAERTVQFDDNNTMTFEMALKEPRLELPRPLNISGDLKISCVATDGGMQYCRAEVKSDGKFLASISGVDAGFIRSQVFKKFRMLTPPFDKVNPSEMNLEFKYVEGTGGAKDRAFAIRKPERGIHFSCRSNDDGSKNWAVNFKLDDDLKGAVVAAFHREGSLPAIPTELQGKGSVRITSEGSGNDKILNVDLSWSNVTLRLKQSKRSGFDLFVGELKLGGETRRLNCDLIRNY